jgi:lipoate-protein ligase A
MLCIYHESTDPYFNVATDEYILKHIDEDCFMLWRNDNAIIVGKYQNTYAEINYDFVKEQDIAVVRRISGGGAVYHDLGNLNFSFTKQGKNKNLSDFEKFTRPIVDVLQRLGANATFNGKNDLSINGKKIAGNAAHIYKNKILHHGCLLFSSEMRNVSEALRINPVKYIDKAVKSVPKRVTNISDHLKTSISIEAFTDKIMDHVISMYPNSRLYKFSEEDLKKIKQLRDEKYATKEWNYGKSPDYNFKKAIRTKGGLLEMNLEVEKGVIKKAKIFGDFFSEKGISDVENALADIDHEEQAIRKVLSRFTIGKHFQNITTDDLIKAMF